jgi:hypothetical protein
MLQHAVMRSDDSVVASIEQHGRDGAGASTTSFAACKGLCRQGPPPAKAGAGGGTVESFWCRHG